MHAALQQGEERLSRVGVHVIAGVFALAMVDRLMSAFELLADALVQIQFVRLDRGLSG